MKNVFDYQFGFMLAAVAVAALSFSEFVGCTYQDITLQRGLISDESTSACNLLISLEQTGIVVCYVEIAIVLYKDDSDTTAVKCRIDKH